MICHLILCIVLTIEARWNAFNNIIETGFIITILNTKYVEGR